jgi:hypothetical protein
MDDDTRLRDRVRPLSPSSIRDGLRHTAFAPPREEAEADPEAATAFDTLVPLPRPGDPYQAYTRADRMPQLTLRLLRGNGSIRGFSYANLDSIDLRPDDDPGQGPAIVLRFNGIAAVEAKLIGRHLDQDKLYDLLGHHRISWVREWPTGKGFADASATVITRIAIGLVTGFPQD